MLVQALAVAAVLASSAGVGIDPAAVAVTAAAGDDTPVGELVVRNPGDDGTRYQMFAQPGGAGREPDADWFHFEPATFELEAGGTQAVEVTVSIPAGVAGGDYSALLTAAIVTHPGDGGVAQISGAVATTAALSIPTAPPGSPAWVLIGIAIAVLVAIGLVLLRTARHTGFTAGARIIQAGDRASVGSERDRAAQTASVASEPDRTD